MKAALGQQPVAGTEATAIYHVPFAVNFLAKKARQMAGARAAADPDASRRGG